MKNEKNCNVLAERVKTSKREVFLLFVVWVGLTLLYSGQIFAVYLSVQNPLSSALLSKDYDTGYLIINMYY